MTTNSARYRFEFRMFKWAEALSRQLCGARRPLFIAIRVDGAVRRVYCAPTASPWDPEQKQTLSESHASWLYYCPFEEQATGYLEWHELAREVAERLLDKPFERTDFHDVRTTSARDQWPGSWQVIVAP